MSAPSSLPQRVRDLARAVRGVPASTRIGTAAELLRVAPYRILPVVEDGYLIGLVDDAALAQFLWDAPDDNERRQRLQAELSVITTTPLACVSPQLSVDELRVAFAETRATVLPVTLPDGHYLGLVAPADLVHELARPLTLPVIGGMATPAGVYLTTGVVTGGAGPLALVATGLSFFIGQLVLFLMLSWLAPQLPPLPLPTAWQQTIEGIVATVLSMGAFLLMVRLTPIAGFHAAEHQVVHALERHEPLLPEVVQTMPRVHPRCGTNFAAGMLLLTVGLATSPLLGDAAWLPALLLTLFYWRSLGAWMQQYLTTRPATRAQLENGIAAARELLARHAVQPYAIATPGQRLWRSGLLQILAGFFMGVGLLYLLGLSYPPLGAKLLPQLRALLLG